MFFLKLNFDEENQIFSKFHLWQKIDFPNLHLFVDYSVKNHSPNNNLLKQQSKTKS